VKLAYITSNGAGNENLGIALAVSKYKQGISPQNPILTYTHYLLHLVHEDLPSQLLTADVSSKHRLHVGQQLHGNV